MSGDTIIALATPPATSAIALVRLSGPLCAGLAREAFRLASEPAPRRAGVGVYHDTAGRAVDQCVFVLFGANASYTGEPVLEISCHGNPLIARTILRDCVARGCRGARPGEFTQRAFLNGRMDLTQAEAVADAIHAKSAKALAFAQRQLAGEFGRNVAAWTERLLQALAELEAYIDFPEEDLPDENTDGPLAALRALAGEFERAAGNERYTGVLRDGIRVAIVGAPNAGKSSLLNALLGEERALVSAEPGTTRDFISETLTVGEHVIRVTDTAGMRSAPASQLEREGMTRAQDQADGADFCLLVVDAASPPPELPAGLLAGLRRERTLVVLNKADLPAHQGTENFLPDYARVAISARDGTGLDTLKSVLLATLEANDIVPADDIVAVNARHAEALRRVAAHLREALETLRRGLSVELALSDVRLSLTALGEICGTIDNERMLDKLFASFCIGK